MGSSITNWADAAGSAIFQGAGGAMPGVWVWVAVGLCVLALVIGHMKDGSK